MNLTHLQTFLAIYDEGNLSRAADRLHLSQPAVTNHLRSIESHFDRPLFLRQPRGVTPTPFGDSLATAVAGHIRALEAATSILGSGTEPNQATIFVGGPADLLSTKILPSLQPLTNQGLNIRAQTGETKSLLTELGNGQLDLVISTSPTRQRGVNHTELFTETLALVANTYWAERIDGSSVTSLANAPMVAYADNLQLIRRYWRTVFAQPPPKNPRIVLNDLRGLIETVASGGGWSVVPTYLANEKLSTGAIQVIYQPETPPNNTLYLSAVKDRLNEPTLQLLSRHLQTSAQNW